MVVVTIACNNELSRGRKGNTFLEKYLTKYTCKSKNFTAVS